MVISLEMTFLRCFFYNSLILFASASIIKYRHKVRLISMSFILSAANIAMLYIRSVYVFNMVRLIIFCIFPIAALGKTSLNKIMTVLSAGIVFCGSALIISQAIENIYIHFAVSSVLALAACGLLPVINRRTHERKLTVKISRSGRSQLSAFIDTGIVCSGELIVVVEKCKASNLLTDEELLAAIQYKNVIEVGTVGHGEAGLNYVDICDLCVWAQKKMKVLPARIMLTDSSLPYEALISATNELEASA